MRRPYEAGRMATGTRLAFEGACPVNNTGTPTDTKHRRSIRLKGYDYTLAGAYFVTVCSSEGRALFGSVSDGMVRLSRTGRIVQECWAAIPDHFDGVQLDEFVVMPNHLHGIIIIEEENAPTPVASVGATHASPLPAAEGDGALAGDACVAPTDRRQHILIARDGTLGAAPLQAPTRQARGPAPHSLASIVGSFKSASAKRINEARNTRGVHVWQRNYYEHTIRNEPAFHHIQEYIINNPCQWEFDRENPAVTEATPSVAATRKEPWQV